MTTRCKFLCTSVTKQQYNRNQPLVYVSKFMAVHSGSEENKAFFEATPNGNLEVGTHKEEVFQVGKHYYLDITEAPD